MQVRIYGAQFYGTGVVRAYRAAEQKGKRMRIFVHPYIRDDLVPLTRGGASRLMELEPPLDDAQWELEYLTDHGGKPCRDRNPDDSESLELWTNVKSMLSAVSEMPEHERTRVERHYVDTLAAINRMRRLFDKPDCA
jgi:hypothetical protein